MKTILTLVVPAAVLAVALLALEGACNNVGDCPAASSIKPGGSCQGDYLECPFTLETPSLACDGTSVEGGLATSCICTSGAWVCPDPVSCGTTDDGGGDGEVDGAAETGDDSATDDGGGDGNAADSAGNPDSGGGDAMGDAGEGGGDGATDSATPEAGSGDGATD